MTDFQVFDNFDDLLQAMEADSEAADARVGPEAGQYKPGGYYARVMPNLGVIIYGEILDPVQEDIDAGADEEEAEFQRELRAQPNMQHYRYTKSYSVMCREGEYGDVHVSVMTMPLTKEEFERAKERGWPSGAREFSEDILRLGREVGSA